MVGITDTGFKRAEFLLCFCFGLSVHPGECIDSYAKCLHDVVDHRLHICLRLGREVAADVKFSHDLSKRGTGVVDAALPPRTHFRSSAKDLSIKIESLLNKSFRQERS